MEIDYGSYYETSMRRVVIYGIACAFLFVAFLVSAIAFLANSTYFNRTITIYLGGFIILSILLSSIFVLVCLLIPYSKRKRHVSDVATGKAIKYEGKIARIDDEIAVDKYSRGTPIVITDEKETYIVYFDSALIDCPLEEGMEVSLIARDGFIVSYEVK